MSPAVARFRYERALKLRGASHPATYAAFGRLLFHVNGDAPSDSNAHVAWLRGAIPGFNNRHRRAS